jgi:hypothetical protein
MAKTKSDRLKALVTEVLEANPYAYRCPVQALTPLGKEFFEAMMLAENEGNRKVSRKKLREILKREFKLEISEGAILKHFRGDCRTCAKTS